MSDTIKAVPAGEPSITLDDISNGDYELLFVQHPEDMGIKQIEHALKQQGRSIGLTEVGSKAYPVAIDNGDLCISRPADHYFVAYYK